MATFFSHGRGAVTKVPGPHGGPMPFKVKLPWGQMAAGIVQQAKISHEGNYQFLHSIGRTVYVYVFGDKMGSLVVAGTSFGVTCGNGDGIKEILGNYAANRIAAIGTPVIVVLGDTPFACFLTGLNLDVGDAENNLAQWALQFSWLP